MRRSKALYLPIQVFILALTAVLLISACKYRGERKNAAVEDAYNLLLAELAADASGLCTVLSNTDGVMTLQVRATSGSGTTYCDLSDGSRVGERSLNSWDLSFQRFKFGTNSGTGGKGSGGACATGTTNFSSVSSVSAFGGSSTPDCPEFAVDSSITTTAGGAGGATDTTFNGNTVFKDWYLYNIFTHLLTTRGDVYIVRSGDGTTYYRVRFTDYYSAAGTSGYSTLEAAVIPF